MRDLVGKNAVITGASAGIGAYLARVLAAERMNVALAARSADKLQTLASELSAGGVKAVAIPTDVADVAALHNLVDRARQELGGIDVLINNAGIETYHHYHDLPVEEIVQTVQVNLTASLVLTRLALPHMLAAGRGHIVNMSSTAGKFGPAYAPAYGASKAGLVAFTEALRAEYHGTGVSASVICPGFVNQGGIYERIKQEAGKTPFLVGATSARKVANAVVKAIRKDVPQMFVNNPPMRPTAVICALAPRFGQWLVRIASADYLRKIAEARAKDPAPPPGQPRPAVAQEVRQSRI